MLILHIAYRCHHLIGTAPVFGYPSVTTRRSKIKYLGIILVVYKSFIIPYHIYFMRRVERTLRSLRDREAKKIVKALKALEE